mmetsp:Transcript_2949/g.6703  ORF Transcript_2949/g.6703 Transcript_2949/m.6703 type:complete len:482 (-) Transcript_2949:173-1618(-)
MVRLAIFSVFGSAADDQILLVPPSTSAPASLLVFVPGGNVPNTQYVPLLKALQAEVQETTSLYVSVAACLKRLCIPFISNLPIGSALDAGVKASQAPAERVWVGGHSLGGVAADTYCQGNAGGKVGAGCMLFGAYVSSVDKMLAYKVPVMQLLAELDFGSARLTKMQPYYQAAVDAHSLQHKPVVVLPDLDHSDFCEGFKVPGDLPSAVKPEDAQKAIVAAAAAFIRNSTSADQQFWADTFQLTASVMKPIAEGFAYEQEGWCAEAVTTVVEELAPKVHATAKLSSTPFVFPSPTAKAGGPGVNVVATTKNSYDSSLAATADLGGTGAPVPPVGRKTAKSIACRMPSKAAVAKLLQGQGADTAGVCQKVNQAAWAWAQQAVPQRTLDRYHSSTPCNGCSKGVPIVFAGDVSTSKITGATLGYNLTTAALTVTSQEQVDSDEHSCTLLSPARLLDFLYYDAFDASIYPTSGAEHDAWTGVLI